MRMTTKEINNFGNIYILSGDEIAKFDSLKVFFEEEENFILSLKKEFALEVREDLLILFVQMYLLRFAIPYYQLTNIKFPDCSNIDFLKKVLCFCLTGRCVDDLVDSDSKMFKTYESILIFQKYYPRLTNLLSTNEKVKYDQYLFDSTKYKSPIVKEEINFADIRNDVFERIKYFFVEAEKFPEENISNLKNYSGILLGGLDVNDLIADGYLKNSSTVISNYVYGKYYNDEEKLLLDKSLLNFYSSINSIFETESKNLIEHCEDNKLFYTANILRGIKR